MAAIISSRPEPPHKGGLFLTWEFLNDPYPGYAEMRSQSPVIWLEAMNAWFLSSYDAVHAAFLDERLRVNFGEYQINRNGPTVVDEYYYKQFSDSVVANDPPRHTKIRSIFRRALARPKITEMHKQIDHQCDRFLDRMIEQAKSNGVNESDLVENYSNRIPHAMISSILGVPEEDRDRIGKFVAGYAPTAEAMPLSREQLDSVNAAAEGLDEYFTELIEKRKSQPQNDFVSEVLALNEGLEPSQKLTDKEITANIAVVYTGGQDTQEKMLTNILLALHTFPEAMARLQEDPDYVDQCMHELYRYDTAGQFMGRTATEDVEIGGVTIPRGDTVICSWAAANRDPDYFVNPDELDLERRAVEGRPSYLTFGVGRHSCIGVNLAQSNLPRMLKTLLSRLDDIQVDLERSQRHASIATRGFDSMMISWR